MATNQSARDGVGESMAELVQRRNRQQAQRGSARAAGHQDYGRAIRANQDLDLGHPNDVAAHGAAQSSAVAPANGSIDPPDFDLPNFAEFPAIAVSHPGVLESLIPVWGSGREAIADFQDGDCPGAALNAGLAGLDLIPAVSLEKAVSKGGIYAVTGAIGKPAAEAEWPMVRRQMQNLGLLKKRVEDGHHWLIPQRLKWVPAPILNHPANIHPMKPDIHGRLRHRYLGEPRFGVLERYWRRTPHWSKAATGSALAHAATAKKEHDR